MPWFCSWYTALVLGLMNGSSTEFINSCAREIGAKRLRLELPWEKGPLDAIFQKKRSVVPRPEWVEFPVQEMEVTGVVQKLVRLDRYNVRAHLSDISWVASENKKLNLALQCWKVIVLDSTNYTSLGRTLMHALEMGKSDDYMLFMMLSVRNHSQR